MRLGVWRGEQGPRLIAVTPRGWLDVGEALGEEGPAATDLAPFIVNEELLLPRLARAVARATEDGTGFRFYPPEESRLGPPVARPERILCIGLNYRAHAAETQHAVPSAPEVFIRLSSTLVGPRDEVWLPPESPQVDLEVELCVVMGRGGRRIPKGEALSRVFGYTLLNDVSIRDYQRRGSQWTPGKNFDRTAPCGPFVLTRDELPDPGALTVTSAIDGFPMQSGNTRDMIFDVPTLIADLSTFTTLGPGDLIATGTPPGVGVGRTPPRWVRPGETMHCRIDGLGELHNRLVPEPAAAPSGAAERLAEHA